MSLGKRKSFRVEYEGKIYDSIASAARILGHGPPWVYRHCRIIGESPLARVFVVEGCEYDRVVDAARAIGVSESLVRRRLAAEVPGYWVIETAAES